LSRRKDGKVRLEKQSDSAYYLLWLGADSAFSADAAK
jgi:hypothetical protein